MLEIFPEVKYNINCPECGSVILPLELVWQGVHVSSKGECQECSKSFVFTLPIGQGKLTPFVYNIENDKLYNNQNLYAPWFTNKIKAVCHRINDRNIKIKIEVIKEVSNEIVVLNTLDYIYGHCLVKLLNCQELSNSGKSIVIIIQPFLRWLVPESLVCEIWVVDLGMKELEFFFKDMNFQINNLLKRFSKVYLHHTPVVLKDVNIELFSKIKPFTNNSLRPVITYIWREDPNRLWMKSYWLRVVSNKLNIGNFFFPIHYLRVIFFLYLVSKKIDCTVAVAGFGKRWKLPRFIQDKRVKAFNLESELFLCKTYSESNLVVGTHGSSMLLPSAHADMTISLMPSGRWSNFGQDIIYTETDSRISSFKKRILPLNIKIFELVDICINMLNLKLFLKRV